MFNLEEFAAALAAQQGRIDDAQRPKVRELENAKLKGMFVAADRLGLGNENGLFIAWRDTVREFGARPGMSASNEARKAWTAKLIAAFIAHEYGPKVR